MRKPFYKNSRQAWYVQIDGKQHKLASGPQAETKQAAEDEYHRMMAGHEPITSKTTAEMLIEQFLQWTQKRREESTYEWYRRHLQNFANFIGSKMLVANVKPFHVERWLDRDYAGTSDSYRNGACRAVSRAFNWARKQGLIPANPVEGMERPSAEPREVYITPDDWAKLIGKIGIDDPFADLLWFLRETGCRPFEVRMVQAKHWDRDNRRFVLERKNSKGKKVRRVIRLNDKATEIVTRLALKNPDGPLFRDAHGRPWSKNQLCKRFEKVACFAYAMRHTFCTDALLRGVDPLTVAILMGHKDATMVMRVYNHLAQNDEFLQKKLSQATGEDAA
jgi:integrase